MENQLLQKQQQFHEFFTIQHALNVNLVSLPEGGEPPSLDELADHMPYAFKIASELAGLEVAALRPLRNLGDHAEELSRFLNLQSRKIDLMMSYILQQQDEPEARFTTTQFGGGGITVNSDQPLAIGTHAELKLFLPEEAAAVFCFGEVIECEQVDERYHVSLIFSCIRDEDQDLLVKASLHLQSQQLKKRAESRKTEQQNQK